jgi:hypothetical protein
MGTACCDWTHMTQPQRMFTLMDILQSMRISFAPGLDYKTGWMISGTGS